MGPGKGGTPSGDLAKAIDAAFVNFEEFKAKFAQAGLTRFGSGWAWLSVKSDGTLSISSSPNQDNPLMPGSTGASGPPRSSVWTCGNTPVTCRYQNRRPTTSPPSGT